MSTNRRRRNSYSAYGSPTTLWTYALIAIACVAVAIGLNFIAG